MNQSTRNRSSRLRRAFSLLELLIAIAIVLAIGGLVLVNLMPTKEKADIDLVRVQINEFSNAMKRFNIDVGRYPTDDEGLAALWSKDALEDEADQARYHGPYLEVPAPNDSWGNPWVYTAESESMPGMYEILSLGPDGEEGTDDDISSLDRFKGESGEAGDEFSDIGGEPIGE